MQFSSAPTTPDNLLPWNPPLSFTSVAMLGSTCQSLCLNTDPRVNKHTAYCVSNNLPSDLIAGEESYKSAVRSGNISCIDSGDGGARRNFCCFLGRARRGHDGLRPHSHRTRTRNASKWDLGAFTLHASNIKGVAFEFALRLASCVNEALWSHERVVESAYFTNFSS